MSTLAIRHSIVRNRARIVVVCRKAAHGRLLLRTLAMPVPRVEAAPLDGVVGWNHWLWGHPPPVLLLDAEMQPEQIRGADLVILIERLWRGGPLWTRVVGRPDDPRPGLFTRLRGFAEADGWQ